MVKTLKSETSRIQQSSRATLVFVNTVLVVYNANRIFILVGVALHSLLKSAVWGYVCPKIRSILDFCFLTRGFTSTSIIQYLHDVRGTCEECLANDILVECNNDT